MVLTCLDSTDQPLVEACRGEGAAAARSSAASGQERDTHAPPVAATRGAPDLTGAPDVALADRGRAIGQEQDERRPAGFAMGEPLLSSQVEICFLLVILQGLSHMEAAIVQDCRPGTIAWRIHEARRRLRDILAEVEDTPVRLLTANPTAELAELLEAWGWPMLEPF